MDRTQEHLLNLAAKIVSAHVGNHETKTAALPSLIRDVYRSLAEIEPELVAITPAAATARPMSAPARHAASQKLLTCRDCGLTMKMLKRHLITVHGLTPDDYRAKWGLPSDEPMVTSEYAKLRSSLAKQSGLGKRPEARAAARRDRPSHSARM